MGSLTGKTVVVTGASKGIGAAIATALVSAGARVIAHYGGDRAGAEAAVSGAAPDQAAGSWCGSSSLKASRGTGRDRWNPWAMSHPS